MKAPYSVLIVHGDGSRLLHFSLPRWVAFGTLGSACALAAMIGVPAAPLVPRPQQMAADRGGGDESAPLDSTQARLSAVRREIMTWKALHAKMLKAFGVAVPVHKGADGGTAARADAIGPPELRPLAEVDLLTSSVADEGPRLRELERRVDRAGKIMSELPLTWPIHGSISSGYGVRRSPWGGPVERHPGIDIRSMSGTPVRSPAPGTVVAASSGGNYGKNVVVDHGNGVRSRYAHMKKVEVKIGQRVDKGQVLGLVGSTGRSTGPHLHYEVLVAGKPVDPRGFLDAAGRAAGTSTPASN